MTHETLLDGRLISEADVKRAENVVVIDERMALSFFAGNEPVGQTVTLSGLDYEVAGVIKAERRLGETNEHIAYIPITSASANALAMQTVEMIAKTADKTTGSAILMENTLKTWQPGGSFVQLRQAGARRGDADPLGGALCWGRAAAQPAGAAERGGVGAGLPLCRPAQNAVRAGYARGNDRKRAADAAGLCGAGGRGVRAGEIFD
ncbi:MAG: ABC transporter permease [Christensenellales bacterium]